MSPLRNRIQGAIADLQPNVRMVSLSDLERSTIRDPAKAFERDMQPICQAVAEAMHKGDLEALKGLRGMLPHLLQEVNKSPALADVLAHQMGKAMLEGLQTKPEEAV